MTTSVGDNELDFMLRRYNEYYYTRIDSHAMFGQRKELVWKAWIPDIHYLQTPFLDTQFTQGSVNFVGLAAQFGLESYFRLKYRADEELFRPLGPALLSCAVLGFQYFCREPGVRRSFERLIGDRSTFNGRKELVKFILEDVDPKSAFQSGMLARIRSLIKLVESYPGGHIETTDAAAYKDAILALLNDSKRKIERREWGKTALFRLGNVYTELCLRLPTQYKSISQ